MATTGVADFNMDFTEIAEEAWERAGREMRSGYDLRTARRSMNLLTIEWQNRGINMPTYASIPNKLTEGRPIQINVERLRDNPVVNIWPVPDQGTALAPFYVLRYWRMRRIQNAGAGIQTPDVSFRFLPCLVAGLAYYIASKDPDLMPRIPMLQAEYERQFELAAGEDREKATIRLVPRLSNY